MRLRRRGDGRASWRVVLTAMVAGAVMVSAFGFAEWLTRGDGAGRARAGRAGPLTASPAEPTTELFPGGTAEVAFTVSNPNAFSVTIRRVSQNGVIASDSTGCDGASNVFFTDQSGLAVSVPGGGSSFVSLPGAVSMVETAPDACQGVAFTIPVAINAPDPSGGGEPTPPSLVISQIYGAGGNSGATFANDYVELFNRGSEPVDLGGLSVQTASAAGSTWTTLDLSGTVQPGAYYLVQLAGGGGGGTSLPSADATGTSNLSASAAKVALVNGTAALSSTCSFDGVVDLVGYGTANCAEGSGPASGHAATTSTSRKSGGCIDTNDNSADFETGSAVPRNGASPATVCA